MSADEEPNVMGGVVDAIDRLAQAVRFQSVVLAMSATAPLGPLIGAAQAEYDAYKPDK